MNTIERQVGNKAFVLPEKIPYPVLRWFTRMSSKPNPDAVAIMEGLFSRIVIKPKITPEYLDTEADIDDFALMQALMLDVTESADERIYALKKKLT